MAMTLLTLALSVVDAIDSTSRTQLPSFFIENDSFVQDGVPMQIVAGEIHYSRVPIEYWKDRLLRLRAMGLNTIQTYVPWNWHAAARGYPDFSGDRNVSHFISLAQDVGLLVIVRKMFQTGESQASCESQRPSHLLSYEITLLRLDCHAVEAARTDGETFVS